jgi:hypothetical protein
VEEIEEAAACWQAIVRREERVVEHRAEKSHRRAASKEVCNTPFQRTEQRSGAK